MKVIEPFKLVSTDSRGNHHEFSVKVENETKPKFGSKDRQDTYPHYTFFVAANPIPASGERFEFGLAEYNADKLKIDLLDNRARFGEVAYTKKGITPALIEWASKHFERDIESSTNLAAFQCLRNEYRTPDATAVWDSMVKRNLAYKIVEKDVYVYPYVPVELERKS